MANLFGTMKALRGLYALLAVAIFTLFSTAAIVATYSQLSHTWDEGTHVVAGLEFLQDGRYTLQTENPPLARVALAVVPYLAGARLPPPEQRSQRAAFASDIFYRTPQYIRNVTEARIANLFFFWACIVLTWLLAGGRSDPWVALLASAAVATLPPIVAHSGFATTDVAFVASFLLALLALRRVLFRPNVGTGILLGAAVGIAVATKFSTLVFLPPAVIAIVACHYWPQRRQWFRTLANATIWRILITASATAGVVVWASYGFDIGRLGDLPPRFGPYGTMPTTGWPAAIRNWRIPGHEFIHGLLYLKAHAIWGHPATLFDEFSQRGFLLFYPVVLLTKTPLPFLAMSAVGLWGLSTQREDRRWRWFLGLGIGALGVLLVALASPINLGVRHVLVIYPLVALAAACGIVRWAEQSRARAPLLPIGVGCLALQLALLISSVPNQVTYFNIFAGSDPAYISSDSDFDWGQDALAMERYFDTHQVPELYIQINGTTQACRHRLPPLKALPIHPVSGWLAISERIYRLNQGAIRQDPCAPPGAPSRIIAPPGWLDWLKAHEPVAIIGKTIRLYHISDAEIAGAQRESQNSAAPADRRVTGVYCRVQRGSSRPAGLLG